VPPIRENPTEPDPRHDGSRIEYVSFLWDSQDELVRIRDRQIEENLRMLSGQQWTVFKSSLGRFVDVTRWMTDEEKRWRQRPVFNRLLLWFMLTHARMTENPPVITFVPGPDRLDAELAATFDIIWKAKWREIDMNEIWDRAASWLIPSGLVYLRSRLDLERGKLVPREARSELPMIEADGAPMMNGDQQPMMTEEDFDTGLDEDFNPTRQMTPDGPMDIPGAQTFSDRKGDLAVDVMNPLMVRGEWSPRPWHQKRWHMTRSFFTPLEIMERWKVDVTGEAAAVGTPDGTGALERILFGKGFFGAAEAFFGSDFASAGMPEQMVEVFELTHAPVDNPNVPEMKETEESPGGRSLICTRQKVLFDDVRPVRWQFTSSIRAFDFVRVPGRAAGGSTPQEAMNGAQRSYNRGWAQIIEHRNLTTNPKGLIDATSGLEETDIDNEPGTFHVVAQRPGVPAFQWVAPPPLGEDVYRTQALLLNEINDLGALAGTEGDAPTQDASGELVKELRFNADRFIGPTMRRAVNEMARMGQDWLALMPLIFDREELFNYAGADNVARTAVIIPEMFVEGKINIVPDVESMLPEGRGERQARISTLYAQGLFGIPGSPEAVRRFFELSSFPHIDRAQKFGGIDRVTADQENGQILQGMDVREIPVFEWYDDSIHIFVHEEFMKSPEFLKQEDQVRQAFEFHRGMHIINIQMKLAEAEPPGAPSPNGGAPAPSGNGGGEPGAPSQSASPQGTIGREPEGVVETPTAAGQGAV
jgi:hypothetical protein